MFTYLYNTYFYYPLYNALIYIVGLIPTHDIGIAVVILTIVVKLILFPLSKKSVITQIKMKQLDPELKALQAKYKNDKPELSKQLMAFYKNNELNPFSGMFLIILQIPVILALAKVFYSKDLHAGVTFLYGFITFPAYISNMFLGLFDLSVNHSLTLAVLVGISQFIQAKLVIPPHNPKTHDATDMGQNIAKSMNTQMKYVMPIFVGFISFSLPSIVSIYWITSNIFAIFQELYFRKTVKKEVKVA